MRKIATKIARVNGDLNANARECEFWDRSGEIDQNMVDRGRWLGNPANFKYSEQRNHLEVEQGLTVHKVF